MSARTLLSVIMKRHPVTPARHILWKVHSIPKRRRVSASFLVFLVCSFCIVLAMAWGLCHAAAQTETGTIRGLVTDDMGNRISSVRITARNPDSRPSIFFASTDESGVFVLNSLASGKYELTFESEGFRKTTEIVLLSAGATLPQLEVKLAPSSLQGVVVDAVSSTPLGGATVSARTTAGIEVARAVSDETGQYAFGRLPAGTFLIVASLIGYDPTSVKIYLPLQSTFSLSLSKASSILIGAPVPQSFTSLSTRSSSVQTIYAGRMGKLWVGTSQGLAVYQGDTFTEFERQSKLSALPVQAITESADGSLWIGTPTGAVRSSNGSMQTPAELDDVNVRSIARDSEGNLWFATNSGAIRTGVSSFKKFGHAHGLPADDVASILPVRETRQVWIATAQGLAITEGDRVRPVPGGETLNGTARFLFEDRTGQIWAITERGVFRYASQTFVPFDKNNHLTGRSVTAMTEDSHGNLWFATDRGAVLYSPAKDDVLDLMPGENIHAIGEDAEGNIWIGSLSGVTKWDLYSFVTFNTNRGLTNNDVRSIYADPATHKLWIATARGISRFDGADLVTFDRLTGADIRQIVAVGENNFWFATAAGAVHLAGEEITTFTSKDGLPSDDVMAIAADSKGVVWAGTRLGAARIRQGIVETIPTLARMEVRSILCDQNNENWFATSSGAWHGQDGNWKSLDKQSGLPSDSVYDLAADHHGAIWIATAGGVRKWDRGAVAEFPLGHLLDGELVHAVFEDHDHFLWFGAASGKLRKYAFLPEGVAVATYSAGAGRFSGTVIHDIAEDQDGHIWIATDNGITRHTPVRRAPTVQVRLLVNGRETDDTHLPYGTYNLAFRFTPLSTTGETQLFCQLEGGEQGWHLIGPGDERRVSYNDCSSGHYTLRVRGLSRDLYGSDAAVSIPVSIETPFWRKWWFYLLSVLWFGGLSAALVVMKRLRDRGPAMPLHLQSYVPIEPNPYIVGNPIRTEQMFFGREDDFHYVELKLEAALQGVVIVFCGDRRTGKSSILYQILNGRLSERFVPVFIDLQELVVESDREFFTRVMRTIAEAVRAGNSQPFEAPGIDDGANPFALFSDFLEDALEHLSNRTLLILFDEYEMLESKVADGKLSAEVFDYLAALVENRERLSYIFTGSKRLEERDRRYWRKMLGRAMYRKVSFLSENDARRLITEPVADRVVFGKTVVDSIFQLTAGQPFYTQVLCQNLVDYLNDQEKNLLMPRDLQEVVEEIVDNPLPQMIYFWDGLNQDERVTASILAEVLEDGSASATARELHRAIRKNNYPVSLSEDSIHMTLEELFRTDVLLKNAGDAYQFRIGLLRVWIKRSHSVWQVLKERQK